MHRRLVLEEPLSRAALWSRRLAWFSVAVLSTAVATFRLGEPSLERLTPIAGAYGLTLVALAMACLAFLRIWRTGHRGVGMAGQAFALALLMLAPAGYGAFRLVTLPNLNDISTDIETPPAFSRSSVALAARGGRVPPEVPAERRRAQRQAYPRVLPLVLESPADVAFEIARRAALARGWQVLEAIRPGGRSGAGRIEAVARSPVLRFADDITIRVRPRADGSRIDIRSASRLGSHDLGANAARIARFIEEAEILVEAR